MALYTWKTNYSNTKIKKDDITSAQLTAFQNVIDAYCSGHNSSVTTPNKNVSYYCTSDGGCNTNNSGKTLTCGCNTNVYCYPATCSKDT